MSNSIIPTPRAANSVSVISSWASLASSKLSMVKRASATTDIELDTLRSEKKTDGFLGPPPSFRAILPHMTKPLLSDDAPLDLSVLKLIEARASCYQSVECAMREFLEASLSEENNSPVWSDLDEYTEQCS